MNTSLWIDGLDQPGRPQLPGDQSCDVAIVGAGYSGLWTAYYLRELDPGLRITVIDANHVGFGASGRNGGWLIGEIAAGPDRHAKTVGVDGARTFLTELFGSIEQVEQVCRAERIDCDYQKGGALRLARRPGQLTRIKNEVEHLHDKYGLTDSDVCLLNADEARARVGATSLLGALWFAHAAAIQPFKLVIGLAQACERHGITIYENTPATRLEQGKVLTDHGSINAEIIVRAAEGFTPELHGERRRLAPIYSSMIATEPLSDSLLAQVGLADREVFSDDRHLVIYGQRTADGRVAFGGRGAPYNFGSAIKPSVETASGRHTKVEQALYELFPMLAGVQITHRWGGVLGVPRDWFPSVGLDRSAGLGWLGGYVGEGVAASNLAGRTLAELIAGTSTTRTAAAWVNHRSRRWEPEPLRWLGINGALNTMRVADAHERKTDADSPIAKALWKLLR